MPLAARFYFASEFAARHPENACFVHNVPSGKADAINESAARLPTMRR
jgi:hypothetical protein